MFAKLRTARHLRLQADDRAASIEFLGRTARIARVHQEGLSDSVNPGGPTYEYPSRALLGFSDADRQAINDLLLEHLAN
jgi:phage virion morphogenesis protein